MKVFDAVMATDGTVAIPKEVCSALGLQPQDRVRFEMEGTTVRVRPSISPLARHYGSVTVTDGGSHAPEIERDAFEEGVAHDVSVATSL